MSVLADWLTRQAPAWLDGSYPLTPAQRRALLAIIRCRTPALGRHLYRCTACDQADFAYHSCHHRACPRCGGERTAEWTQKQMERLLPVPYFLVTFTVPEDLRPVFAARPELLHDLFFQQAARVLQIVACQPRHLGAELGMLGVLHTWGRQLQSHPHWHFIIPGGGLCADRTWRAARTRTGSCQKRPWSARCAREWTRRCAQRRRNCTRKCPRCPSAKAGGSTVGPPARVRTLSNISPVTCGGRPSVTSASSAPTTRA